MKANSKRRVLVSSLSMLLVATVSLGAATYAWFTSNTTATAQGINVKTIQASELVISDKSKNWDTTINYGVITDRTTGFCNIRNTTSICSFNVNVKREKSIRT